MAVAVTAGDSFESGKPVALFGFRPGGNLITPFYSVTRDGQRFLLSTDRRDTGDRPAHRCGQLDRGCEAVTTAAGPTRLLDVMRSHTWPPFLRSRHLERCPFRLGPRCHGLRDTE